MAPTLDSTSSMNLTWNITLTLKLLYNNTCCLPSVGGRSTLHGDADAAKVYGADKTISRN